MDLYLHIGTNKTGSSFLQTLLITNQTQLLEKNVWLPPSKWDNDMLIGKITPGNGYELASLLLKEQEKKLLDYFSEQKKIAKVNNCNKVVLSNEILVRLFSNRQLVSILENTAYKAGFAKIVCFCLLRNPYEHALSLYKHRAKNGEFNNYEKWFETDYETIWTVSQFLSHFKTSSIDWNFRLYRKDSEYLTNLLFLEFLGLSDLVLKEPTSKKVNISLNLKYIRQIQLLEKETKGLGKYLYAKFIEMDQKQSESKFLLNQFYVTCRNFLEKHEVTVNKLAEMLPSDERSTFLKVPNTISVNNDLDVLSERDIQAIEEAKKLHRENIISDSIKRLYLQIRNTLNYKKIQLSRKYGGSLRLD